MFYPDANKGELTITWELNYKCQIECPICLNYSDCVGADIIELKSEEKVAIAHNIVENVRKLCIVEVYLTGGEPLEDKAFSEIINILSKANNLNLYIASTLNPLIKNKKLARTIADASKKNLVFIHINGLVIGYLSDKKYKKFARALKYLWNLGVKFRTGFSVGPFNLNLYNNLIKRMYELSEYFDEISVYPVIPSGRAIRFYYELINNYDEYKKLFHKVIKVIQKIGKIFNKNISIDSRRYILSEDSEIKPLGSCLADRILHITPSGAVYPCSWFAKFKCDIVFGFLPDETISNIVYSKRRLCFIRWLKNWKPIECKNCTFQESCGYGCPIMSLIYKGSINKADPLCSSVKKKI